MTFWQRLIARWREGRRPHGSLVDHLARWQASEPQIKPIARATRFQETRVERFCRRNGWKS